MFYPLISIKSVVRLISIIGMLAVFVATAQLSIDSYENKVIEKAQLSVTQPDKDSNRDLGETLVTISLYTAPDYFTYIHLQDDYANYQEPTLLLDQRPPRLSLSLA